MTERTFTSVGFYALIAIYAASRILQAYPQRFPMIAVVALHVLPPLLFAWLHGRLLWGSRGILVFFAICSVVGSVVENFGVATGFPFGRYFFTEVMGPKIFHVPILLGLAYLGMGYLSWIVASLILGWERSSLHGWRLFALPAFAALVMTSWDLCMDPVWSTLVRAWVWKDGGAYFGVPFSNFVGWYANVFIIYLLFAIFLRSRASLTERMPPSFWQPALCFYAASAVGNFLLLFTHPTAALVADPSGKLWDFRSIAQTCALTTVFTMGTFLLLAWIRVADRHPDGSS